MKKYFPLLVLFVFISCSLLKAQVIAPEVLQHAHAHNDYAKARPLWDALENGCASIEIDVFALNNELRVSHVNLGLSTKPTLTDSYLVPLKKLIEERGAVYPNQALILMIDFKSNSEISLQLLEDAIFPMKDFFTYYHKGVVVEKNLKLVISGSGFQYNQVAGMDTVYFFKDGSVTNCAQDFPVALVPRGSASYGSQFSWKGKKEMPESELLKLRKILADAKICNKNIRFYAMPAKEKIWLKFLEEGVYWINIDKPKKYKVFSDSFK
jgi:hypothetical protein